MSEQYQIRIVLTCQCLEMLQGAVDTVIVPVGGYQPMAVL